MKKFSVTNTFCLSSESKKILVNCYFLSIESLIDLIDADNKKVSQTMSSVKSICPSNPVFDLEKFPCTGYLSFISFSKHGRYIFVHKIVIR